jgi:hypothetical protein
LGSTRTDVFSIVVNKWPKIGQPTVISAGLMANLDASTYSRSGSWLDTSGNGKNATFGSSATLVKTNPTFSTDSGGIFSFNETTSATTNYLQIANPGSFDTFTVSTWVKFKTVPSGSTACIICEAFTTPKAMNYVVQLSSGTIIARYYTAGGSWSTSPTAFTPSVETWYNIAFVTSKSGIYYQHQLFINGVATGSPVNGGTTAPAGANSPFGNPINVGRNYNPATESYLNGSIGGVLIYNRFFYSHTRFIRIDCRCHSY